MNFILISPAFPNNFKPFAYELKKQGMNVLGIGNTPYSELGEELQNTLTEYYLVEDMENVDLVKRAVAYLYFKHGKIDRIESHNEYWLELDAELREAFNVPGVRPDELQVTKRKSEMKKGFKKAGVPVAEGIVIESKQAFWQAIDQLGYPVVAKPDIGVGSAATFMITHEGEAKDFEDYYDEMVPYFIEQAIQSDRLGSYDGLIDQHGKIVWDASLAYSQPTLAFIDGKADMAFMILPEIDPKLRGYGKRIIEEFGMKERFFHIEFFKMPDGEYIALEYNNRIAGNFTVDMYNFAHSINLFKEYARIVKGKKFEGNPNAPKKYALGITQRDIFNYAHSKEDIYKRFGQKIKLYDRMPEAFSELMGNYFYAMTAETKDEVDEMIEYIHKRK